MSKTIYIGGRLESKEKGNVVTGANAILDDTKGKKQNVINKETDDELLRLEQSKQDNLTFDNAPTEDSTNPVTSGGVYTAEKALSDAIEAILLLIPSAATALNKLVDTNTMNSSISTATATFRGTYNAVSDLGLTYQATHAQIEAALDALGLTADNNDFAFVQIPVSDQSQDIAKTERFKFNGTNWLYEYDLNTSGFTAAQWAAINSTITLALVQKLAALPTNAELLQALGLKQDVLTFDNVPTTDSNNPVKSGGIKTAIDTAVGNEAIARENADTALSGLIGDENKRAEGVEGGLDTRLGAVEGSVSTIQGVIPSEASSSNKLVEYSSMTTYIGTIIDNIDATFNVTSTDGHVTLAITQVNGVITSVQLTTSDIASAGALTLLAGRVTTAEGNITSLTGRMTTAEDDIDQLLALYNALQQSAPQVIQPTDTWPVANPSTTTIYRVIDRVNTPPEYYSDYMWNGTAFVLMATYNNAVDTTPQKDSANLVTSGGVFANIGAFDISEYHKSGSDLATYVDLAAALAALPSDFQKGGMSIKFVQTSDNKYVQYRLMATTWSINESDWQGVDDEPVAGSNNLVKSGGVNSALTDIRSEITSIDTDEGFFISDENGNVGMSYTEDEGLDAGKVSDNLKNLIVSEEKNRAIEAENTLRQKTDTIELVDEEGFFITDEKGNIATSVDKEGNVDSKGFGENLRVSLEKKVSTLNASIINRANSAIRASKNLFNRMDKMVYSSLPIKDRNDGETKTITIGNVGVHDRVMVKVGMHYGTQNFTPASTDVFFGGNCKTDFSDIRFFDSDGNIIKAELGEPVNMDFLFDRKLNKTKKFLSDGTLVGYDNGVCLSEDGGVTWSMIQGTTDEGTASAVYARKYMYPVFVDSNDNIYAYRGGKLYKLVASDYYATIKEVLDFSWNNNGTTVYPDIQNHAMDEDRNGNLFVGACYQVPFHVSIFSSSDNGETFTLSWASWDSTNVEEYGAKAQHVHHIHADKYSDKVYVGIDDYATTVGGPIILVTSNGGNTWTDITENLEIHGCDYYPTYFGSNYRLGGGECYATGGNTLIRSTDDVEFNYPLKGYGGIRSYGDFGNDDIIIAGVQTNNMVSTNQIVMSKDKGLTWVTVVKRDITPTDSSGAGFRDALSLPHLKGETERCVIICADFAGLDAMRIYKGGNHYYREAYLLLENTHDADIVITAKSGYTIEYPYDVLEERENSKKVYKIPLNEGCGRYIIDSEGNAALINGDYSWDKEEPVRFGDYFGENIVRNNEYSGGLLLDKNAINFGRISKLSFTQNYAVSFWLNMKKVGFEIDRTTISDNVTRKIMSFGNIDLAVMNGNFYAMERGIESGFNAKRNVISAIMLPISFSDNYIFVAVNIKENAIEVSLNGNILRTNMSINTFDTMNSVRVSDADLCIGSDTNDMAGYISDVCFYDSSLSQNDIIQLYKGYNI